MPTLYPLTLASALANLRTDLSDTDNTNYRWTDAALTRAIDKSVERYSWIAPWLQSGQIPALTGCILYAYPSSAYYIDRVEYPVGRWPKSFVNFYERKSPLIPAPTAAQGAATSAAFKTGGNLGVANYGWSISYTVPGGGETTPTLFASLSGQPNPYANGLAVLTGIPTGPYGVSGRTIYRSSSLQPAFHSLGSLPDNITTTYTDSASDASIASAPAPPGTNTTANWDQFEMQIPPELWPADTGSALEITYATKHGLDSTGTSIPERHWDALYYGAVAYAMFAYLPTVNDNFEYADGHLRDRVDDTKSTTAWRVQCEMARRDFEVQLALIKEEVNTGITATGHWGDKPLRWERL